MTRVACIGECMIELSELSDGRLSRTYGGDTFNTAVYLARLGIAVDYVTALGDDPFSDEMLVGWRQEGVGTAHVLRLPGRLPGLYLIRRDARGERSFYYWRDRAPARELFALPETPSIIEALIGYDFLYLSGITLSLYSETGRERLFEALERTRARGGCIAFDTNFRPHGWPERTVAQAAYCRAFGYADLVLASTEDLELLFGSARPAELLAHRASAELVLKLPRAGLPCVGPRHRCGCRGRAGERCGRHRPPPATALPPPTWRLASPGPSRQRRRALATSSPARWCAIPAPSFRQRPCRPYAHRPMRAERAQDHLRAVEILAAHEQSRRGAKAMIAVSVEKPNALAVVERDSVAPEHGEVLVRVRRAGICGSDVHILHGSNPFARYPRIIGHEFAGEIEAVGPGVSGLAWGDRVVVDPVVSCGDCYACRVGRPNVCANLEVFGVHRDGGFRDQVPVPARNVVKLSRDLPVEVAALAEPFSIAANVLSRTGCGPEDTVLVYGAGTVGLTVLQVAKLKGARCLVSDLDEARLERARSFGADAVINPRSTPVAEAVGGEMGGLGPSVVIDGAGVPALLEEACRIASPAGRIGVLGFSPGPCNISQQEIVKKELTLVGSRLNRHLLPEVVQWFESGRLKPAAMITQTFDARDARAAFDLVENHPERTVKVQLAFGDT